MRKRPSAKTCTKDSLMSLVEALHPAFDRRMVIFAAGALNNRKLLEGLGSQESSTWYEGRRAADPEFENPYWAQ